MSRRAARGNVAKHENDHSRMQSYVADGIMYDNSNKGPSPSRMKNHSPSVSFGKCGFSVLLVHLADCGKELSKSDDYRPQ